MHTPSSLTMLLISSQPLYAKNLFSQGPKTRKNSFSRLHLGIHSYRLGEFLFKSKFLAMRFFNSVLSAIVKRFFREVCHRLLVFEHLLWKRLLPFFSMSGAYTKQSLSSIRIVNWSYESVFSDFSGWSSTDLPLKAIFGLWAWNLLPQVLNWSILDFWWPLLCRSSR